jgi:hypothetical protein
VGQRQVKGVREEGSWVLDWNPWALLHHHFPVVGAEDDAGFQVRILSTYPLVCESPQDNSFAVGMPSGKHMGRGSTVVNRWW